jgi:hypothetical protein
MARPTKKSDRRLSRQVIFRLTEAEYASLCDKATLAGLPPNELARRLTSKGKRKLVVKTARHLDPAFLKRIDRIGHNLNQLVKNAHIFGRVSPQIDHLCTSIDELITEAIDE